MFIFCSICQGPFDDDGQLRVLEQLRCECDKLWGASTEAYFRVDEFLRKLANPNLRDIVNMQNRVELWTADGVRIRWAIAATANVTVGHAAFDAAVANWPHERFTLRQGTMLVEALTRKQS